MPDTPILEQSGSTDLQLTTDRMVVNILLITAICLIIIGSAVAIAGDIPAIVVQLLALSALICAAGILLARRGISTPGRISIPALLMLVISFIAFNRGGLHHISIAGLPVVIILAGLLLGSRGGTLFAFLASLVAIGIGYADINGISPYALRSRTGYDDIIVAIALSFTTSGVLRVIIQRLSQGLREAEANALSQETARLELQELQSELEGRVQQRTAELQSRVTQQQTIAQVSQIIAGIQNLDELLPRITDLVSERFEIYHTGIFLLDPQGENAVLRAANSPGGQRMLARGHRLKVGAQGIVGFAASTGEARIALDVGEDAVYFDNPDLPETRSEIALPLIVANQVIGALDLQSTQPNAFGDEDVETLSILADQVAIAIQNARSFEQSRKAMEEVEAAYRQITEQAWRQTISREQVLGYEYDGATPKPISGESQGEPCLDIPLLLRGQTIGNIKLIPPDPNRNWTDDELALVQAAAERTALALENARLLEDAQRRAAKEQVISEGTTRVSAALDVESILQTTAAELERALGSSDIVIQLESQE